MEHSDMQGPCCCKCWRWKVYGGLGKYLIHTRHYTGQTARRPVEHWPGLWRSRRYQDAL